MTTTAKKTLDDLLDQLSTRLAEPGHSLLPVLKVMSQFTQYSLANQFLIYGQRPTATRVLGYQGWRHAGYQVRKGEKGIAIYAPMRFATQDPDAADADPTPRLGFRVAYVFDITQVEPLPGTLAPESLSVPAAEPLACLDALKTFLRSGGLHLAYAALPSGYLGHTDGRTVTCALGLAPHVEFATLVHETTHALLHFTGERPDLTTRETEAEAVTYILCEQLGLPDTQASVDYIKAYRGSPDTLESSLLRIRATAERLGRELAAIPGHVPATTDVSGRALTTAGR